MYWLAYEKPGKHRAPVKAQMQPSPAAVLESCLPDAVGRELKAMMQIVRALLLHGVSR